MDQINFQISLKMKSHLNSFINIKKEFRQKLGLLGTGLFSFILVKMLRIVWIIWQKHIFSFRVIIFSNQVFRKIKMSYLIWVLWVSISPTKIVFWSIQNMFSINSNEFYFLQKITFQVRRYFLKTLYLHGPCRS